MTTYLLLTDRCRAGITYDAWIEVVTTAHRAFEEFYGIPLDDLQVREVQLREFDGARARVWTVLELKADPGRRQQLIGA